MQYPNIPSALRLPFPRPINTTPIAELSESYEIESYDEEDNENNNEHGEWISPDCSNGEKGIKEGEIH